MRLPSIVVAILFAVAGLLFIGNGFLHPLTFKVDGASAAQIAQVYSESTFIIVQGIALWVIAIGIGVWFLVSNDGKV